MNMSDIPSDKLDDLKTPKNAASRLHIQHPNETDVETTLGKGTHPNKNAFCKSKIYFSWWHTVIDTVKHTVIHTVIDTIIYTVIDTVLNLYNNFIFFYI